ncbi:ATPase- F0 complex- subunit J [Apiospora arundinis]|uniref:ATPase- F0 complex- subunit J n=1 Tax=Apiospora kogelbergensis TaxID=1337665 RepID=A0AAW0RAQ1_9PEZI
MAWFGITPSRSSRLLSPLAPFFAAGAVILYGVNSAQNAMMRSDEWKNDARNPNAKSGGH